MNRNQIVYGQWVFANDQIQNANIYLTTSLMSDSLEANTFTADVECEDRTIVNFERNAPLVYSHKGVQIGIFYVQDIVRIGPTTYTISATSAIGMLIEGLHYGGIYNGETVAEILPSICGSVPYEVKSSLQNIALYGWLPVASPRDNLSQVLFAIGATVKTDLNGILRIEGLWDGVSGSVGEDALYRGQDVEYAAKVTRVVVTEHQYTEGTEEMELFNGTSQAGDIITFSEPMHNLSATGFTITESGSNYAILSAGTGVLTGQKYIHNTRQVSRDVAQANTENVVSVEDATLVSLVNSVSVAERLVNYYQCRETISGDILLDRQSPGDVVSTHHPYDHLGVQSCLESLDINVSGNLRANAVHLVGFTPIPVADSGYITERAVLTGSGNWQVPDGVTYVRYILFSGAQGGKAGLAGGTSSGSKTHSYRVTSMFDPSVIRFSGEVTLWSGPGGKGGAGGSGGNGSKILDGEQDVTPGQTIAYSCGIGGDGADYSNEEQLNGSDGTATTFGNASSNNGTIPPAEGWTDPVTGEIFAVPGLTGISGGDGAGAPDDYTIPENSSDLNEILKFKPATDVVDEDGVTWHGGPTMEKEGQIDVAYWQNYDSNEHKGSGAWAGYALGPGTAAGVNVPQPTNRGTNNLAKAWAADGVQGATPTLIPKKPPLTQGGRGGYGGGGGSCASWAGAEKTAESTADIQTYEGQPGPGGNGGKGGPGGDGMIILFYSKPIETPEGAIIGSDNLIRLDKYGRLMVG